MTAHSADRPATGAGRFTQQLPGAPRRSRTGALFSGLGWMGNLREALSEQWGHVPETPPIAKRLLFDLLEEYARHTGHADLLREAVDGRVGEDPPEDWRPGGVR